MTMRAPSVAATLGRRREISGRPAPRSRRGEIARPGAILGAVLVAACAGPGCLTDGPQMPPGFPLGGGIRIYWPPPVDDCTRDAGVTWAAAAHNLADRLDAAGAARHLWPRGDLLAALDGTWVQVEPGPLELRGTGEVAGFQVPGGVVVVCQQRPELSALAHEWIHLWGASRRGNPDRDHARGVGWWTEQHDAVIEEATAP